MSREPLKFHILLAVIIPIMGWAGCHHTYALDPPEPLPVITDVASTEVSLITVGLGNALHARYGHTFIKIKTKGNLERIYNWGMFSFDDPLFGLKFYLGDRTYWVASTEQRELEYLYQKIENRNVWQQKIHLSPIQLSRFLKAVTEAIRAENMFFRYEHFFANCATIPRDLINDALGGYLSDELGSQISDKTYRDYVKDHMAFIPPLGMALDVLMNSKLDSPMSLWDETFYPAKLSEYLSTLDALSDDFKPDPTTKLLGPKIPLVGASNDHHSKTGSFGSIFCLIMSLSLALLILMWWIPVPHKMRSIYRIWAVMMSVFWGAISGGLGTLMVISWLFSTHLDMHHNLNLALFYPTDFVFMIWGLSIKSKRLCAGYMGVHLISMAILTAAYLLGIIEQDIHTSITQLMPIQLGFLIWLVTRLFRRPKHLL